MIRKISLGAKPVADFSHGPGCVSSPVKFTDLSHANTDLVVVWKWNFDNTYSSDTQNPVVNFNTEGIKKITLSVGTNYGRTADTTGIITITGKPVVDFNFSQTCDGLVNYTGLLLNTVPAAKWLWQFGDNNQSGIPNTAHFFQSSGTYQTLLLAFSDAGCPSDSIEKTIIIDKVYPFAGNDTIISRCQPLQLQGTGGNSYQWVPSTGLNNPLIKNPVAVLNANQDYVLIVWNATGCEATDTVQIKVYNETDVYVPNAFIPKNDGKNDVFKITAPGIAILAYLKIYDRWGKIIYNSADIHGGWDGRLNGHLLEPNTFVWILKAIDYKGNIINIKGTVMLNR